LPVLVQEPNCDEFFGLDFSPRNPSNALFGLSESVKNIEKLTKLGLNYIEKFVKESLNHIEKFKNLLNC